MAGLLLKMMDACVEFLSTNCVAVHYSRKVVSRWFW